MVIDVECERGAGDRLGVADSMLTSAVDRYKDALGGVHRRFADEISERQEAVLAR